MAELSTDEQIAKDFTITILSRPNSFTSQNPQEIGQIATNLYKDILKAIKADKPKIEGGPRPVRHY
jgi:hypothetical protein